MPHAEQGGSDGINVIEAKRSQGASSEVVRDINRRVVLNLIRTRQPPRRTLQNPILRDQLFHDQRDGTALQAGCPRQVGARDRLTRANQVEDNPPVDISDYLAGSALAALGFKDGHPVDSALFGVWHAHSVAQPATNRELIPCENMDFMHMHVESHFEASDTVRDIEIGRAHV